MMLRRDLVYSLAFFYGTQLYLKFMFYSFGLKLNDNVKSCVGQLPLPAVIINLGHDYMNRFLIRTFLLEALF
jgi:hypothetical protein